MILHSQENEISTTVKLTSPDDQVTDPVSEPLSESDIEIIVSDPINPLDSDDDGIEIILYDDSIQPSKEWPCWSPYLDDYENRMIYEFNPEVFQNPPWLEPEADLTEYFNYDFERMRRAGVEELSAIEGVGEVIATAFRDYFDKEENQAMLQELLPELNIEKPQISENAELLAGKVFVITGRLNFYANRDELKAIIEERGGKVTGSVTGKTTCLINNDITSSSSKNKKAKELQEEMAAELAKLG